MIHGLDFSLPMLSRARNVSHQLVLGDMTSLPFESASFDVIISGLSIGHVRNLTPVFCEISRVLRPNGVAVYSDIHPFGKLAGWKRKFKVSNGQEYSIEHHFHLYKDHHFACHASGLQIEDIREPLIEGKHQWAGSPAILAIRVRKILS
jgi:ubiquinone/menaquinone biosynthesis C-methylase UbiE